MKKDIVILCLGVTVLSSAISALIATTITFNNQQPNFEQRTYRYEQGPDKDDKFSGNDEHPQANPEFEQNQYHSNQNHHDDR